MPERWSGVIEHEGNLGRTDLLVDATLSFRLCPRKILDLGAKVPLHSWVVGEQASYPAIITIGLQMAWLRNR